MMAAHSRNAIVDLEPMRGEGPGVITFSARLLDDDETRSALAETGFPEVNWIDAKWGIAKWH